MGRWVGVSREARLTCPQGTLTAEPHTRAERAGLPALEAVPANKEAKEGIELLTEQS